MEQTERINKFRRYIVNNPILYSSGAAVGQQGLSMSYQYLPPRLAATASELSDYVQAPEIMVIVQMLAMASSIVMLRHRVQCGPGMSCQTGLAALTVAEPNLRKSTLDRLLASAITEWQQRNASRSIIDDYDFVMATERHRARVSALRSAVRNCALSGVDDEEFVAELGVVILQKPKKLIPWVQQITTGSFEGLAAVARRQGSVFWNAADGGAALDSMAARHTSQLADFWSGNCPTHVTRSHGFEGGRMVAFAASIAVQPEKLSSFMQTKVGKNWKVTGMLGRFIVAAPTSNIGFRHFTACDQGEPKLTHWRTTIEGLLTSFFATPQADATLLTLTPAAFAELQGYRSFCEVNSGPGRTYYDVRDGAGKSAENAARIAAVFHVLEGCEGTEIQVDLVQKAVQLARLSLDTYLQQFGDTILWPRVTDAADSLVRYMRRQLSIGVNLVPLSSLSKHGCKDLRDANIRIAAINLAFKNGWVFAGFPTSISKNNLILSDLGRSRAEMTEGWPKAIRIS